MPIKECGLCGNLINYEREEEYEAHRRGCRYRLTQKHGQEGTYLGTAGRGLQRQHEYDQECENNYHRLKLIIARAVEATRSETSSRETWDQLKTAQEELKRTQPLKRDKRDELWNLLQEGFANEKKKRETRQHEWEERQRRCKDNYSRLWQQINGLAQEVNTTTDWRSVRERLKSAQQMLREAELLREDRDALRNWIQQLFETLGKRQDADRQRYDNECASNYNRMQYSVNAACEAARSGSDFRTAGDALKIAQNSLKEARPMKREQKDELFQRLQDAFQTLRSRREEYRQQKEREWETRQRERISNLEGAMARLEESRKNDGSYLQDLWKKMHAVKPGRNADDIRRTLNRKIEEVGARISDKARKLSEMSRDLQRMKDELRR